MVKVFRINFRKINVTGLYELRFIEDFSIAYSLCVSIYGPYVPNAVVKFLNILSPCGD